MARKKKYSPKPFESKGEKYLDEKGIMRSDTSANIYESMLASSVFRDLKPKQKVLYLYCKAQYYGKRKPAKDFPNNADYAKDEVIYMNWNIARRNKLYSDTDSSTFYKDMKALIDHGFLEKLKSGKAHKEKNIYLLSNKWQHVISD